MLNSPRWPLAVLGVLMMTACSAGRDVAERLPACLPDNGGITLPAGFCAMVVTEVPGARHLAVASNGDVYVSSRSRTNAGVTVLRDRDGDGTADTLAHFGSDPGTGLLLRDGYLYYAANDAVLRYRIGDDLLPVSGPDTLVEGLPDRPGTATKSIALDNEGSLFVGIAAPTDACQPVGSDTVAIPGMDPCTVLDTRAGIWRFGADRLHQGPSDGERWATGIRNAVALTWKTGGGGLYAVQQGREHFYRWPAYSADADLDIPAEEFIQIEKNDDFGWPYCYYDPMREALLLAPEYGGAGTEVGRCADKKGPIIGFPAHWGPDDILFYNGAQFPPHYRGGAFIAFHGAGNPGVEARRGYRVEFVPLSRPRSGERHEAFAGGFAGGNYTEGRYRPVGLAEGPDGSLYIADSQEGRIWRVMYVGE